MAYVTLKRNDTNVPVTYKIEDTTVNLTGAKVFFVMRRTNGPMMTYAPAVVTDITTRTLSYTLKDVDTVLSGIFNAEFAVQFADGKERSYPGNGYLQIMIQPNADDEKSTYVMDNVAERVSEMQLLKGEMQAQLNNIVTMGDSSVEVANARVNHDGKNFTTLKERLDDGDTAVKTIGTKLDDSRLTNNVGGVKISITTTTGDILDAVLVAGAGIHSFYAASGSQNLPPSNISIRGIAQVTSENPAAAYIWAIDYRNTMYTNYNANGTWSGWVQLNGSDYFNTITDFNTATKSGSFYVGNAAAHAPTTNFGVLRVDNIDANNYYLAQSYIDLQYGDHYHRYRYSNVWQPWKKVVYEENVQSSLWILGGNDGWYMTGDQTIKPDKKLSQCRNGWILVWSDYDKDTKTSNNWDFSYSYIPKGTLFKGSSHSLAVPNYASATGSNIVVKKLVIYDDKIVGHDDNAKDTTSTDDVVLRDVLEW